MFRGQHSEKMVCVRGVFGIIGTIRKANSHFDLTQTGSGPQRQLLIGAEGYFVVTISVPFKILVSVKLLAILSENLVPTLR